MTKAKTMHNLKRSEPIEGRINSLYDEVGRTVGHMHLPTHAETSKMAGTRKAGSLVPCPLVYALRGTTK